MRLRFNIFGLEVWSLELDPPHETATAVEQTAERLLEKAARSRTLGRVIGRISTAWVATGMRR